MIFGYFILLVALTISAVSAYYSIAGLTAIFAAAVVPVIIMGSALELGKIVATVWMHKYWHRAKLQFKIYLVPAIAILMLITSMGIFGFLSKAHLDQSVPAGDVAAQVQILDEKIKTERDNIDASRRALQQMDAQVDQLLGRTTDDRGANRAVTVRKQQAKERKNLQNDIAQAQKNIIAIQNERAPIAAEVRKVEAEVGPVKYIAALIYGDNPEANILEKAVRWVIILLVLVFDPLALILILAAEQTIEWAREDKKKKPTTSDAPLPLKQEPATLEEIQAVEDGVQPAIAKESMLDIEPLTDEEIDAINAAANVRVVPTETLFDSEEEFFAHGKELAKSIDANNGYLSDNYANTQSYLTTPWTWIESNQPSETIEIPDFSISPAVPVPNETRADFGAQGQMPSNPGKGDMFLRTDVLPNVLFKWNGLKWIEIPITSTDSYVNNPVYIDDLIKRVENREYPVDYLTLPEQEQISRQLNDQSNKQ